TEKFINNYQENLDGIVKALAYSPYGKLIADVVSVFEEKRSLAVIEKQVDNYLVSFVDRCKYIMFGIEPVVAFWIAKEIEIKNLRVIITGKRAGIPDELLKERLRDVYA
ncbi:MAG: V-type ATPase subunit, partial [Synergistetes bacterium]|nr:V-type ATPase subunit [Synergistota bacterium]